MSLLYKKLNALLAFVVLSFASNAQENMPAEGGNNIEVVFGVVLIILLGMVAYLFYIDKKVGKVEERMKELKKS
jgi:hypothetical protein